MKSEMHAAEYLRKDLPILHIKKRAVQSSGAMIFSRGTSTIVQLAGTLFLARLLSPQDFGLTAMVTAFSLLLTNVGYVGFIEAIIQAEEIDHHQISALFWLGLRISFGLAVLFTALSPLLASFYGEPRLISIAIAFAVGFVFNALTTEHLALLMRRMEFGKVMLNEILSNIVSAIVAVAMAFWGFGFWALVARNLSYTIASAILAWVQCPWRPSLVLGVARIRPLIKFALSTFGNFGINYFGRHLDKVLIGWRWGAQTLGNYDRAYQFFVLPVGQIVTPLTNVALATLSRFRNDPVEYRRYFLKALSIIAFVGMLLSPILTVAGQDIIVFLLGAQWSKAGQIIMAFGPSIGIILIYMTHSWLHLSLGTPDRYLKWSLFSLTATALAFLIGLKYGALGMAIAYGLSFYALTFPALCYAGRPIGIGPKHVWRVLWKYYLASLLSGSIVWIASSKIPLFGPQPAGVNLLFKIIMTSLACGALYLIAIFALFRSLQPIKDVILLLREAIPRSKPKAVRL